MKKTKFQSVIFTTKWKDKYWGDFTLIGISKIWFSVYEYEWRLSFFGFDIRFWFKRQFE
jgi:hypothetical protein